MVRRRGREVILKIKVMILEAHCSDILKSDNINDDINLNMNKSDCCHIRSGKNRK